MSKIKDAMAMIEEIDFLHNRCDNIERMLVSLANRLGQHELAYDFTQFHNDTVRDLKELRDKASTAPDKQEQP